MTEASAGWHVLQKSIDAAFRAGLSDQSDAQDGIQRWEVCADAALTLAHTSCVHLPRSLCWGFHCVHFS